MSDVVKNRTIKTGRNSAAAAPFADGPPVSGNGVSDDYVAVTRNPVLLMPLFYRIFDLTRNTLLAGNYSLIAVMIAAKHMAGCAGDRHSVKLYGSLGFLNTIDLRPGKLLR